MKHSLFLIGMSVLIAACSTAPQDQRNKAELEAMSRGPAIGVSYVRQYCRPGGVWREMGLTMTYDNGERRPAVGIMCLSNYDGRLFTMLCEPTGTICKILVYEDNEATRRAEARLRQMEADQRR